MIIWLTIWYQITQIMLSLFDNYLMIIWWLFGMIIWWLFDDYLMIICFIIWSLFDDYLLIIWWLCDAYLMIIWWLFESNYLMIIWWLFDKWLFGDYSMIIWIWLFLIIRWLFDPNYSWLFDDYLISGPAAGWLVCFIPKSIRMEQLGDGSLSPAQITACESRLLPAAEATDQLEPPSCLSWRLRPAERSAPLRPPCFSARGTGPSHHAISDGIQHPAHESRLLWSRVFSPMCYQGLRLEPIIIKIIIIIAIITISIIWLITCWACSALLKPKCQKMSSTRCSIFSLKR